MVTLDTLFIIPFTNNSYLTQNKINYKWMIYNSLHRVIVSFVQR